MERSSQIFDLSPLAPAVGGLVYWGERTPCDRSIMLHCGPLTFVRAESKTVAITRLSGLHEQVSPRSTSSRLAAQMGTEGPDGYQWAACLLPADAALRLPSNSWNTRWNDTSD